METSTIRNALVTPSWEVTYTGYSTLHLVICEDGDLVIEVERCFDDMIFDDEHFDVVVEFKKDEPEPLIYVHEGGHQLKESEYKGVMELIKDYLNGVVVHR